MTEGLTSDDEVTAEQPLGDQRLFGGAGGPRHDVQVGGVEAQSGCRETVGHQVDPQQLDGDESFRHAQSGREEDAEERREGVKLRPSADGGFLLRATPTTPPPRCWRRSGIG